MSLYNRCGILGNCLMVCLYACINTHTYIYNLCLTSNTLILNMFKLHDKHIAKTIYSFGVKLREISKTLGDLLVAILEWKRCGHDAKGEMEEVCAVTS